MLFFCSAKAEPWTVYGNGVAAYDSTLAPSGKSGETAFSIPQMQVGVHNVFSEKTEFSFIIDAGESRDDTSKQYDVRLNEFLISSRPKIENNTVLSIGLLPKPDLVQFREFWSDYFILESHSVATFQGYLPAHDLGAQISQNFGAEGKGTIVFQVTNGEGDRSDETGRRKDAFLYVDFSDDNRWTISLFANEGSYDNIDPKKSDRDRWGARLQYFTADSVSFRGFNLQVLESRDAVDGLAADFAEKVVLPVGTIAFGRAVQAWIVGNRDPWGWLLGFSLQDPETRIASNSIQKTYAGLNYEWEPGFKSALQIEHIHFDKKHSPGIQDHQQVRFLTRIDFD